MRTGNPLLAGCNRHLHNDIPIQQFPRHHAATWSPFHLPYRLPPQPNHFHESYLPTSNFRRHRQTSPDPFFKLPDKPYATLCRHLFQSAWRSRHHSPVCVPYPALSEYSARTLLARQPQQYILLRLSQTTPFYG